MAGLDVICIGAVNYDYMFRCTAEDLITDESEGAEDLSNSTELVERDIRELIRKDREYTTQLGGSAFITLKVIKYIFMHMKTAYVGVCGGLSDFELRFGKTNDLETELEHLDNREWFFTTENRFDRPENRYVAKSVVRIPANRPWPGIFPAPDGCISLPSRILTSSRRLWALSGRRSRRIRRSL